MLVVLPVMCLAANVQNRSKDNTPKKGDFMVAATVGYNSYINVTASSGLLIDYEVRAPLANWADKKLMVGFGGGWFSKDQWKLNSGGGISFTNNPGYPATPGTADDSSMDNSADENMGETPNYRAVASAQSFAYNVPTGADRYSNTKCVPNLMWYTGVRVGLVYSENKVRYDEETSADKSVVESWNLRSALTVGVDYCVLPAPYIGAQAGPFAYTYNKAAYNPQTGLGDLSADSHNYSTLTTPTFKIGLKS